MVIFCLCVLRAVSEKVRLLKSAIGCSFFSERESAEVGRRARGGKKKA